MNNRKNILPFILGLCLSIPTHAQNNCLGSVKSLYDRFISTNKLVITGNGNEGYTYKMLFQGKSKDVVLDALNKAETFYYGGVLDSMVVLNLGDKGLYFRVSTEGQKYDYTDILDIFDFNGRNLLSDTSTATMQFAGVIDDPDGFVNVRDMPSVNSKVVEKIKKDELFFYTPIWGTNWCKVEVIHFKKPLEDYDEGEDESKHEDLEYETHFVGYIHKSRIMPFEKCSRKIQRRIEHLFFC